MSFGRNRKGRYKARGNALVEEELDPEFRQWIEDFPKEKLPQIYELLKKYREGKKIFIFKSRDEAEEYLKK